MAADADFVSDLMSGADTISANEGNVESNRGSDAVQAFGDKAAQPTKVDNVAPAAKEPSLRDQISSALKGEENTPPASQQDGGPARGPDGKFAPKVADPNAPVDPLANPDPNAAPAAQPVQAPRGLSPQDAEVFAKLPAELQTSVARTMESLNEQASRYAGYAALEQQISPRREAWAMNGMTEAQAVGQLFALSDFAGRDPTEFVKWFAQNNGVDLEEIIFGAEPVDPTTAAMQREVQELRQQLTGMTTQQQQTAHQNTVQEIVTFAEEKGQDGQPLRPFFSELGDSILPFIQAVQQQNPNMDKKAVLQEAYDRAAWGTPTIRAKMQQAADQAREAARMREQQDAVKRARSAGGSVNGSVPETAPAASVNGSGSLRDDIRGAIASLS